MAPRILQNGRLLPRLEEDLAKAYDLHPLWREQDPAAFLAARGGEFEGLAAKMAGEGWAPDFGPKAPHPSAGASVIGARMALIAYNINLATDRLDVAKKIAAAIRQSSGGFRFVKAAGFELKDRGIVQVSMNLTNYEKTPIFRVFETVKREADRYGVTILESEIVGLVPEAALPPNPEQSLQLTGFNPNQVLEHRLKEMR